MSRNDIEPVTLSSPPVHDVPGARPSMGDESVGLWALINDRLQGRWIPAILVGVSLGLFLGFAGYQVTIPLYQSTGLIRIAPRISPILRDTVETGTVPLYENFVRTQARLITSRRVLERAIEMLPEQPSFTVARLRRGLTVKPDRGSELITVHASKLSTHIVHVNSDRSEGIRSSDHDPVVAWMPVED